MKTSRVFWISFAFLAVLLLSVCSKKKSTEPEPTKRKWTVLGYFDGNNTQDLSSANLSYVIKDVQEMEKVGSTDDVQVIVMLGSIKTQGICNYYLIEKQLDEPPPDLIRSEVLEAVDEPDMSDSLTLRNFIEYGVENYPAERYMLLINDHGCGWRGICLDEQNGYGEMMSLPGLAWALSGYRFEIIVLYAPSMSTLEVAHELRKKAGHLIASQFKRPMQNILGSSDWLQSLTDNPDMSSRDLARSMVDAIYNAAANEEKWAHIAVINLSNVDGLASRVMNLGDTLRAKAGAYWNEVFDAFNAVHEPRLDDSAFTDIKKLAQAVGVSPNLDPGIKSTAQAVEEALGYTVIKSLSNPDLGRGGLSIHLPWKSGLFDSTNYVQLDFESRKWHSFLSHFIASTSGCLGGLRICSSPVKGARIFIDGEDTGLETDTTIHGLLPDWYLVKVVKEGYPEKERHLQVISGTVEPHTFILYGGAPRAFSPSEQAHRKPAFRQ